MPKTKTSFRPRVWAMVGGAVALALAIAAFDPYLFTGGDNAQYYALTRALATGRGYVDLVRPGAPPHTLYPPGYPALLVPFYLASGGSLVAMKLLSLLAAAALLWGVYALARRDPAVPAWAAAAAVGLVGLYPAFREYTHWVLSDMTYTAIAAAALLAFQRHTDPDEREAGWAGWILACALAVGAFYVRVAGVALFVAVVGWALLERRWRRAAAAAAFFAIGALPWIAWSRQAAPGSSAGYVEQAAAGSSLSAPSGDLLRTLGERFVEVVVEYGTYQLPGLFWPVSPPPPVARALGATLGGALLLYGAWRVIRQRGLRPWDLYVGTTLGLIYLWPWLGERIVLTLAPFLWFYLLAGADDVSRQAGWGRAPAVAAASLVALALFAGGVVAAGRQIPRTRAWLAGNELAGYSPFWQDYFDASRWIGANAPDAVVLARKPTLVWYWSGRPTVVYPFRADPDETWRFVEAAGVSHLLLDPSTERALAPALESWRDRLELAYRAPRGQAAVVRLASPAGR
ncbi:MAG: glycosyltransferase family 39 protein [Gemmatimonadota bacterium]